MALADFNRDVSEEIATILAPTFSINVVDTRTVPHSDDGAITFPNLDQKSQGTKLLETTVLYIDMRRSTQLSLQHQRGTVAKLYSAFVRAMTRCAAEYGGEVRGIIGDRVMVLFEPANCFAAAIDTAILMNSVCSKIINKHFTRNDVTFGIGIDYGRMLATKTGIRRHGSAQQSYRSLVWLGRPANIASKLTDNANKPEEPLDLEMVRVAYMVNGQMTYRDEYPHLFVKAFTHDSNSNTMRHCNNTFHSFTTSTSKIIIREATPPILMTQSVYDGFRRARPNSNEIVKNWLRPRKLTIPEYPGQIYGGNLIFPAITG